MRLAGGLIRPLVPQSPVIIDSCVLERVSSGGTRTIDQFVLRELTVLKKQYRRIGDPVIVGRAAEALLRPIVSIPSGEQSFQVARLHGFLADLLIASGGHAADIGAALSHLDAALATLEHIQTFSSDLLESHVSFALLSGVARKALGRFDESLAVMRDIGHDLVRIGGASRVVLVPLERQRTIMLQTVEGHRALLAHALTYRETHPREYYGSIKRVFEFLLNTGRFREAEMVFPEWRTAYLRVRHAVPPVSHVSAMKNYGQLLISRRDIKTAESVLSRAYVEAQARRLFGQVRQIGHLLAEARNGLGAELITYRVEPVV